MADLYTTQCCGIRELNGVEGADAEELLLDAARQHTTCGRSAAYIFFSCTAPYKKNVKKLAALIKKNKLGKVTMTEAIRNPNSGNSLTMWVWRVENQKLRSYWAEHNPERAREKALVAIAGNM